MRTSIFELFKIGIGPSSSHTVGPMRAAAAFAAELAKAGLLTRTSVLRTELYGSLALTGVGHGTDTAILLGLAGELPDEVEPEAAERVKGSVEVRVLKRHLARCPIVFHRDQVLPGHPNAMRFTAFGDDGLTKLLCHVYFSVGGGFIQREGAPANLDAKAPVPFPFGSAQVLMRTAEEQQWPIWKVILENEKTVCVT